MFDRLSRPPLAQRLKDRGTRLNRCARGLVDADPLTEADLALLARSLAASAACWQVLRWALPKPRRRRLKQHRKSQAPWLARSRLDGAPSAAPPSGPGKFPSDRDRRVLRRQLNAEAIWLEALVSPGPPPEALILKGLRRLYRRARRAVTASPRSGRTQRRLAHLVLAEELIFDVPGPNTREPAAVARRELLALLERGGRRRRRRSHKGEIAAAAERGFPQTDEEYLQALSWRTFLALADSQAAEATELVGLLDHSEDG